MVPYTSIRKIAGIQVKRSIHCGDVLRFNSNPFTLHSPHSPLITIIRAQRNSVTHWVSGRGKCCACHKSLHFGRSQWPPDFQSPLLTGLYHRGFLCIHPGILCYKTLVINEIFWVLFFWTELSKGPTRESKQDRGWYKTSWVHGPHGKTKLEEIWARTHWACLHVFCDFANSREYLGWNK